MHDVTREHDEHLEGLFVLVSVELMLRGRLRNVVATMVTKGGADHRRVCAQMADAIDAVWDDELSI